MFGYKWNKEIRIIISKPVYVYDSITYNLLYYFPETIIGLKELKIL